MASDSPKDLPFIRDVLHQECDDDWHETRSRFISASYSDWFNQHAANK